MVHVSNLRWKVEKKRATELKNKSKSGNELMDYKTSSLQGNNSKAACVGASHEKVPSTYVRGYVRPFIFFNIYLYQYIRIEKEQRRFN